MPNAQDAPPPWHLTGRGLVLVYRFPQGWALRHGHLAPYQRDALAGRWGAVMLVDYATSGVGPYHELLCLPGTFRLGGKTRFSISKIYVSTEASVVNGRHNWGIPKEKARFDWSTAPFGRQQVVVRVAETEVLTAKFRPFGPKFPLTTALLPLRLHQQLDGQVFETRPTATGWGRLARLHDLRVDPALFPDLNGLQPLVGVFIERFTMTFPVPDVKEGGDPT
jgi:hypothetical protein